MRPTVSIVVPFFNEETFLEEAVASVFGQTYSNWELLLVDDGSTDGSPDIARRLARGNRGKVRYLSHPGGGNLKLPATRNLGVRHARGDLIALLDADDVWYPEKLEQQVELLAEHPDVAMVCGASLYWRSWSDGQDFEVQPSRSAGTGIVDPPDLLKRLYPLGQGAAPSLSGLIVRCSVVREIGGFVEEFGNSYEDQAFLAKVYLAHKVWVDDRVWDRYRLRPGSISASIAAEGSYRRIRGEYLDWLIKYLRTSTQRVRGLERRARWLRVRNRHLLLDRVVSRARRVLMPTQQ